MALELHPQLQLARVGRVDPRELVAQGLDVRAGFLDPLAAMSDPSLPLATEEREEWGDPTSCDATAAAMAEYSPASSSR